MELLVTSVLVISLLAIAIPNVERMYRYRQLNQFALEIMSFFALARSEATRRKADIFIRFSLKSNSMKEEWQFQLMDSKKPQEVIKQLDSKGIAIVTTWDAVHFDKRSGRIKENGNLLFYSYGYRRPALKLVGHQVTGRIRICAVDEPFNTFPEC